jgi:hypothetical protein
VNNDADLRPDTRQLLQVVRDCLTAWKEFTFPVRVAPEREDAFRIGFPLVAHALNTCAVALDVWDRFPWVARANARVALEHAFSAQWVYITEDGPQQLLNYMSHSSLTRAQDFAKAIKDQPELTALVPLDVLTSFAEYAAEEALPGAERSRNLQNQFGRFERSGLFYDSYRDLSAGIHPSLGTLAAHFEFDETGLPKRVRRNGSASDENDSVAEVLALTALWALNFLEKCRADPTDAGRAAEVGQAARLPYDLGQSDSHGRES